MYIKKILVAVLLIGLVAMAGFSYYVYKAVMGPNTQFSESEKELFISSDDTYQEVFQSLQPYLKNTDMFHRVAEKKGYTTNIKPGRYIIKRDMSNNDIINTLRSQNKPVRITFNNQDHPQLLAERISKQIEADSLSLINAITDTAFLEKNNIEKAEAMSLYIPNSYEMYWNTSAEEFRKKMYQEFQKFWNEERRAKAEKLNLTPQEVSTLASIVQKETSMVDERPRVAGVYINRLRKGMKLQADPTVIYGLKEKLGNHDTVIKRVLNKDLVIDSPYNTYKYAGLPPGQIAMPDISAIEAVLNFEEHDYLFFVADLENPGYHKFARTLREHTNFANQYRQWMNKQKVYR
ncbi:MAG: endolytic transglycosylase MltG [Bacteroidota bacterium]